MRPLQSQASLSCPALACNEAFEGMPTAWLDGDDLRAHQGIGGMRSQAAYRQIATDTAAARQIYLRRMYCLGGMQLLGVFMLQAAAQSADGDIHQPTVNFLLCL